MQKEYRIFPKADYVTVSFEGVQHVFPGHVTRKEIMRKLALNPDAGVRIVERRGASFKKYRLLGTDKVFTCLGYITDLTREEDALCD